MKCVELAIPDVKVVTATVFGDDRGYFTELYNSRTMAGIGITAQFVQQNLSLSRDVGTLRGLHYQRPPNAQTKLVRVSKGSIYDVAVDIRRSSPTYGQHVGAVISAENQAQIFVPRGFLHGFVTLEADTEVVYQVDAFYSKADDGAVRFDDSDLRIDWMAGGGSVDLSRVILSDKDRAAPFLRDIENPFD